MTFRQLRPVVLVAVALTLSAAIGERPLDPRASLRRHPTSPIGPPVPCAHPTPGYSLCPCLEPDYVPNYESVVPQAIRTCGGSFDHFEALTEGAERAIFTLDPGSVTDCVSRNVPQGHVEAAGGGIPVRARR